MRCRELGFHPSSGDQGPISWWRIRLRCGRPGFGPWVGKIPWRRERLPTPVFWPGEFHIVHGVPKSWARLSDFHFHAVREPSPCAAATGLHASTRESVQGKIPVMRRRPCTRQLRPSAAKHKQIHQYEKKERKRKPNSHLKKSEVWIRFFKLDGEGDAHLLRAVLSCAHTGRREQGLGVGSGLLTCPFSCPLPGGQLLWEAGCGHAGTTLGFLRPPKWPIMGNTRLFFFPLFLLLNLLQ